jgi:hypothetical protein
MLDCNHPANTLAEFALVMFVMLLAGRNGGACIPLPGYTPGRQQQPMLQQ